MYQIWTGISLFPEKEYLNVQMNICLLSFQKLPYIDQSNGKEKILAVFARELLQETLS